MRNRVCVITSGGKRVCGRPVSKASGVPVGPKSTPRKRILAKIARMTMGFTPSTQSVIREDGPRHTVTEHQAYGAVRYAYDEGYRSVARKLPPMGRSELSQRDAEYIVLPALPWPNAMESVRPSSTLRGTERPANAKDWQILRMLDAAYEAGIRRAKQDRA